MTDREAKQVKVADTPAPKWDGAWYGQGGYAHTLFQKHPVDNRQLRESRYVVCSGTGELLYHLASEEDAKMSACGKEGGGSVVA